MTFERRKDQQESRGKNTERGGQQNKSKYSGMCAHQRHSKAHICVAQLIKTNIVVCVHANSAVKHTSV